MKILVAIDSSDFSTQILHSVGASSWPADAEFLLLTCVEFCHDWQAQEEFLDQSRILLENRANILRKKLPNHKITSEVLDGSASKLIVETARTWRADLIVVGSHGDTGVRRSGIGSVAAAVVNDAPCSVEVIKVSKEQKSTRKKMSAKQYSIVQPT